MSPHASGGSGWTSLNLTQSRHLGGTAATLGIGALQMGRGVEIVSGWSAKGNTLAMVIIIVLMRVALVRELRHDPAAIRTFYEDQAVSNAILHGVREYGDNFALAIQPTEDDSDAL